MSMVPTRRSSGTTRRSLKAVVVVAKEPMTSVSRKSVTKPMAICINEGRRLLSVRDETEFDEDARLHWTTKTMASAAILTRSVVLITKSLHVLYQPESDVKKR